MRAVPLLLVVLALVVAGCLAPEAAPAPAAPSPVEASGALILRHSGSGLLAGEVPLVRARFSPVTGFGAEPTIGLTRDGALFLAGAIPTVGPVASPGRYPIHRSLDHGHTWEAVGDPVMDPHLPSDPWMWVDPLTDRVYHSWLEPGGCVWLTWTDDRGGTWDVNPVGGCGLPGIDHQKITTGPPAPGVATTGYASVVYLAYNSFRQTVDPADPARILSHDTGEGSVATVSLDGGRTFSMPQVVFPADDCHSGINGPIAVGPDGTAYLPRATCEGVTVAASRDSGATWPLKAAVDGAGILEAMAIDPSLAVDEAGNVFLAYPGRDGAAYLSASRDRGATWSAPARASPPGVNVTVFAVAAAGAPGRVAIAYLGTDAAPWAPLDPSVAPPETVWHLYLTWAEDALTVDPVFVTARLTSDEDPVQRGCITLTGGRVTNVPECGNLYDFMGIAAHEGRVYVSYTDGCDACADAAGSTRSIPTAVVVEEGPSLLGGVLAPISTITP